MKFARYLEDTQTPEWKKAYIDYRGLKKHIKRIRKEQQINSQPHHSQSRFENAPSTSTSNPQLGEPFHAVSDSNLDSDQKATFRKRERRNTFLSRANSSIHTEPVPLSTIIARLTPIQTRFFEFLDAQLHKIENFYIAREKELRSRTTVIEEQLDELKQHREQYHHAQAKRAREWADFKKDPVGTMLDPVEAMLPTNLRLRAKRKSTHSTSPSPERNLEFDPNEYQSAKKSLKRAILEHYRMIQMLHNYRVLNITGFRKAVKKFEKFTGISVQKAYMTEKVEGSAFSSDKTLRAMMNEMEALYTSRFTSGDKKRAMLHLRNENHHKTHHFSSLRSGLLLGTALPALVSGIYKTFQPETRASIVGWDGLLFAYGVLLMPVALALLIGLNLLIWSRAHINYVFIFELNPRTRMDYREYFETPSLLLCTLCYAFWLSFFEVGSPHFLPIWWPLVWLAFVLVYMLNPMNILFKPSRYWLIRSLGRLLIPGVTPVEFTDFWMGDQFCSLAFPLGNLYLFGCAYRTNFENWQQCGSTSKKWPVAFFLASLPSLVRLVQSIRRYTDSGLVTHLINGGKYGAGVVYYAFYYFWRHQGGTRNTAAFVLFCLFGTVNSVYTTSWDILMDWSLLRPHVKYPFLRDEAIYTNHIYLYYVVQVVDLLIRFIWVIYIPSGGPNMYLLQFIAGSLEVARRWLWNFYRLENEHLGNMDQYRASREVPLPYSLDEARDAGDDGDESD